MDYCSLMSGSWGNCHFVQSGKTSILIDAGQSAKRILANMSAAGCCDSASLSAIVVTHAHRDHIAGVGILARRLGIAVYATEGTWLEMGEAAEGIPAALRRTIGCAEAWRIGSLDIEAFPTAHDALESVGFVVRSGDNALGIATDSGVFTSRMERALQDVQVLVLEANHDLEMLRTGKYPYYLKRRIAGTNGHLSNDDAGKALGRIGGGRLRKVVLAHLSEENNTREIAHDTVARIWPARKVALSIAPRCTPGEWIAVG